MFRIPGQLRNCDKEAEFGLGDIMFPAWKASGLPDEAMLKVLGFCQIFTA